MSRAARVGTLHPIPLPQCLRLSLLALQATRHIKTLIKALETREPQNPSLHLKKILVVSRLVSLGPRFCLGLLWAPSLPLLPIPDPNNSSLPPRPCCFTSANTPATETQGKAGGRMGVCESLEGGSHLNWGEEGRIIIAMQRTFTPEVAQGSAGLSSLPLLHTTHQRLCLGLLGHCRSIGHKDPLGSLHVERPGWGSRVPWIPHPCGQQMGPQRALL